MVSFCGKAHGTEGELEGMGRQGRQIRLPEMASCSWRTLGGEMAGRHHMNWTNRGKGGTQVLYKIPNQHPLILPSPGDKAVPVPSSAASSTLS